MTSPASPPPRLSGSSPPLPGLTALLPADDLDEGPRLALAAGLAGSLLAFAVSRFVVLLGAWIGVQQLVAGRPGTHQGSAGRGRADVGRHLVLARCPRGYYLLDPARPAPTWLFAPSIPPCCAASPAGFDGLGHPCWRPGLRQLCAGGAAGQQPQLPGRARSCSAPDRRRPRAGRGRPHAVPDRRLPHRRCSGRPSTPSRCFPAGRRRLLVGPARAVGARRADGRAGRRSRAGSGCCWSRSSCWTISGRRRSGGCWGARLRAALRPSVLSLAIVPVPFLLYLWWLQSRFGNPLVFLEAEQKGWLHTSTFFPQVWLD